MQQNSSGPGPRPKVEPQYVRFVGDSVGVVNLTPNALQILSDHVTQLLMKIITNSKQYTLHGRRTRLHGEDIEAAVKQLKLNLPCSLSLKKSPQFRQFTTPAGEELYVREEYDVEVATVAEEQKPKFVAESYMKSHWLAYDGKLALVPENVRPVKEEEEDDLVTNGESSKAAAITSRRETAGGHQGASVSFRQSSRNVQTKEHIQIKAPIVESLSVEQQLYIKEIVEAVVGTDEQRRIAALYSLESDTGLQPILPKLSRLVSHAVRFNILAQSMPLVIYLIRIYKSFSLNTSLKLENVLHEMIPTMLSCILCANLCRPENENHWALRDFAGKTLCAVVNKHGNGEVRERALRVIKQAWEDPASTIPVKFGCIFPLLEFLTYDDPFNTKFLNEVKSLHNLCSSMQNNPDKPQVERSTGTRVTNQLLKAEIAQKLLERNEKVRTKLQLLGRRSEDGTEISCMVPRVQMSKDLTAVNGIPDDDAQPSTSTANFGDAGYVRRISAVLGIEPGELSDKAIQDINSNVSYVLRSVIAGSLRFANHSRRTRVLPEDVDAHLALERKPVLYGFKPRDLTALRLAGSGGRDVFVEEDKEIELAPIYTASASKIPPIPSIRSHWLAIDGEQPAVPENPVPYKRESKEGSTEATTREDDIQEETNRLLNIIRGPKATESVNVKTTTTHSLSLEQQVYYKEITEAIMGGDDHKRTEALHSLRTDSGIQSLVGRFSVAVAEGVRCNIVQHNLAFLIYLMRLVQSLVQNSALSVDKWLHEFLPSILSCILSRQVCTRPESDNHWALREFAGRLLVDVCRKHQGTDIQSRVIKVLTKAWLDPNASMSTIYGSLYTMDHFGPETVRSVVLPMIPGLYELVEAALTDRSDQGERLAADRLNGYTTKMLVTHIRSMRPVNLTSYQDYVDVLGGFADSVYRVVSGDAPVTRTVPVPRGPPSRPVPRATPTFVTQPRGNVPGRLLTNGNHQARYSTPNLVRRPPSNASGSSRPGQI